MTWIAQQMGETVSASRIKLTVNFRFVVHSNAVTIATRTEHVSCCVLANPAEAVFDPRIVSFWLIDSGVGLEAERDQPLHFLCFLMRSGISRNL